MFNFHNINPRITSNISDISSGQNTADTIKSTFNTYMTEMSQTMQQPYQIAGDMMSGKKPFDSTEIIMSMLESQHKVNFGIRALNDIVKAIKQLEAIQA